MIGGDVMLGNRLKQLREEKGLLQKDIAKILNISTSAYGFYEQGKRDPDTETLTTLSNLFDVSVDYLLGITDVKNANKPNNLTRRDLREIEKILEETKKELENAEGLMFSGQPATPEAIQSILDSMRIGMEIAKQRNKEKYTPKKYKKNKGEDNNN